MAEQHPDMQRVRRNRIDLMSPAERSLYNASLEIQKLPSHVALTEVETMLNQARSLLADYVDAQSPGSPGEQDLTGKARPVSEADMKRAQGERTDQPSQPAAEDAGVQKG